MTTRLSPIFPSNVLWLLSSLITVTKCNVANLSTSSESFTNFTCAYAVPLMCSLIVLVFSRGAWPRTILQMCNQLSLPASSPTYPPFSFRVSPLQSTNLSFLECMPSPKISFWKPNRSCFTSSVST